MKQVCALTTIPLPSSCQIVAEIIGRDATLLLAAKIIHNKIYIPSQCSQDHWITKTIGKELADKLCKMFAGENLDFAKCSVVRSAKRNLLIEHDLAKGLSIGKVVELHKVSRRTVHYITSAARRRDGVFNASPRRAHHNKRASTFNHPS